MGSDQGHRSQLAAPSTERCRVRSIAAVAALVVLLALCAALAGCGGQSSTAAPSASLAANRAPAMAGALPPGVDPTSLASVATAYAKAADPWRVTSFAPQAAFWPPKCLAARGGKARRAWSYVVSVIPRVRKVYARAHIAEPLPSVPKTADILGGSGRRGVPITQVTPADRVAEVFFIDPRTGSAKTAMQPSATFSFVGGAWRYDLCDSTG